MIFIFISICVIIIATLYPFNFYFDQSVSIANFFASFNNASSLTDRINNILLFMPLGFFGGYFVCKKKLVLPWQIIIIFFVSGSLSLTIEILQIFLPSRTPTPADIVNNTLGGCLGLLVFYFCNFNILNLKYNQFKEKNLNFSKSKLTIFSIFYISLIFMLFIFWTSVTNLSNWNFNFHLLLGNENTGDRPWNGYISQVYIAEKAITKNQVSQALLNPNYFKKLNPIILANYQLNTNNYQQEITGKSPKLIWQGKPQNLNIEQGLFLNSQQWLKTKKSVNNISQRISQTSEFTISINLSPNNIQTTATGRILSISQDTLRRNLTISQQGNGLELRLRTPLTGENGTDIQILIPEVFKNTSSSHLIITYNRGNIHTYIDKLQNQYSLNLLELIPFHQKLFYYGLTFIPLGGSLAIFSLFTKHRKVFSLIFFTTAIILPTLILEVMLIVSTQKNFSCQNISLGIFFTGGTIFLFQMKSRYLHKSIRWNF